jgi:hypothetical protein
MFIFSAISIAIKAIIEDLCSIHNKLWIMIIHYYRL